MGPWLLAAQLLGPGLARGDPPACPGPATLTVVAQNLSADVSVSLELAGELRDPNTTCTGAGQPSYSTTLTCSGNGVQACGTVPGLQPGAWVHRIRVQVTGSNEQVQSQRGVVLASAPGVTNAVTWTIYPTTFVVRSSSGGAFLGALDEASAFTADSGATALVTFDPTVFPGAGHPVSVNVGFATVPHKTCAVQTCPDGKKAAYCLTASRVVVDALDANAERGGVVLLNGTCARYLLRVYGSDNVMRGLELHGIDGTGPLVTADTLAIAGPAAVRNRIEQCRVVGGSMMDGDAVSVNDGAGAPGGPDSDDVIVDSEITGATDKGVKVVTRSHATVETSCIHDNLNGGIQSTDGGNVTAIRNVVQFNRLGPAQNGLLVGVPEVGALDTMVTDGNIVRFSGARGISAVNAASGVFRHDFVAENQVAGAKVETTRPDPAAQPRAQFRGLAFICNDKQTTGTCLGEPSTPCVRDTDCPSPLCTYPPVNAPPGSGFVADIDDSRDQPGACETAVCLRPLADLGTEEDAGRNAIALNVNPGVGGGANLNNAIPDTPLPSIPAWGNQWEHCGTGATCDVIAVDSMDLRPPATAADIGTPTGPGAGPAPTLVRVEPARPKQGDFVRVYNGSLDGTGGTFNGIDGAACTDAGLRPDGHPLGYPGDPCSPENPNIVNQNRTAARGNTATIAMGGLVVNAEVHAVTPTMLVFRMPVDCFAPATLTVTRGTDGTSAAIPFCDAGGCVGQPAGVPCDDGDVCTLDEHCDGNGRCAAAAKLTCSAPCQMGECDPVNGCALRSAGAACDDGNACTAGDHCSGTSAACVPGAPATCSGACLTGACDPARGCVPLPASTACDDGNACTAGDHCSGTDGTCVGTPRTCDDGNTCTADRCDPAAGCVHAALPDGTACPPIDQCHGPAVCRAGSCDSGAELDCSDGDFCTDDSCDPATGCRFMPVTGIRRISCRVDALRALLATLPPDLGQLRRRLVRQLDRVDEALTRTGSANAARRARRRARDGLQRFLGAVRNQRHRIGLSVEHELVLETKAAMATLAAQS